LGEASLEVVAKKASLRVDQTRRAVEWLRGKEFVRVQTLRRTLVILGPEGRRAAEQGLPERRFVKALDARGGRLPLEQLANLSDLTPVEGKAALGHARRLGWIQVITDKGQAVATLRRIPAPLVSERLLARLGKTSCVVDELAPQEAQELRELAKRPGFILFREQRETRLKLTPLGIKAAKWREPPALENLTSELLSSGRWRRLRLRPLDVEAPTTVVYPGKKHPLQQLIDETREVFVSLGFEEIDGPVIRPAFWNFDALFIPQDHPAREMQDTFYLAARPGRQTAPPALMQRIGEVHETGGSTGSQGWGYRWRAAEARRLVLRTHTTTITVNYLAEQQPKEARVFSVGRIFRNEKPNYRSLVEFHQIDGVTVGPVHLRDMMGLLAKFYTRLGLGAVKFWPTFFPYTEPSLESVVYFDRLNRWIELCGMGIFRPEVTLPLGIEAPVLAWGGGLERIALLRLGLEDVRQLYANDLGWLREVPLCQ
jgi:phenylalanyl-tRNA synthetase alpha chain